MGVQVLLLINPDLLIKDCLIQLGLNLVQKYALEISLFLSLSFFAKEASSFVSSQVLEKVWQLLLLLEDTMVPLLTGLLCQSGKVP